MTIDLSVSSCDAKKSIPPQLSNVPQRAARTDQTPPIPSPVTGKPASATRPHKTRRHDDPIGSSTHHGPQTTPRHPTPTARQSTQPPTPRKPARSVSHSYRSIAAWLGNRLLRLLQCHATRYHAPTPTPTNHCISRSMPLQRGGTSRRRLRASRPRRPPTA